MTEPDPRFPGIGNYLDWLMSLDVLDLTPGNLDEIVEQHRKSRAEASTTGRRRSEKTTTTVAERIATLEQLGLASKPIGLKRRKLT